MSRNASFSAGSSEHTNRHIRINRVIPNLYLIGAPKCGTTSLAHMLSQHTEIFVPLMKEAHYFDNDQNFQRGESYLSAVYRGGIAYRYRCDASPTYMTRFREVIPRMQAVIAESGETRFIVMLRDPIARFISHVMHNYLRLTEHRPLNDIACSELRKLEEGCSIEHLEYIGPGFYGHYLQHWLHDFDRQQFCVLFSTEFMMQPDLVASELQEFLSLPPFSRLRNIRRNQSGVARSESVAKLLMGDSWLRNYLKQFIPIGAKSWLRQTLIELNTKPTATRPGFSNELRLQLLKAYHADHVKLERLLGKPLPWQVAL